MDPSDERRLLRTLSLQLDSAKPGFFANYRSNVLAWVVSVLFFIFLFSLTHGYCSNVLFIALVSAMAGLVISYILLAREYAKQLPIVCSHINRQSVESRLRELET